MSTITLPNIRVSSDLTVKVRLKDSGVAIDWSTLNNVKASIYSDAQRALAGRCDVSIDAEDPTLLVCQYAANKPQYVGVNRIVVSAKYHGETKTYDKPAFSFVRWTGDQAGEQITIDDPDVDVEIEVSDVSSSLLDEAIRAAFTAAEEAVDAKGQVLETEAEVEAAEALRVSAEESRVEAEEGRAEAEAARVDEEAVRVSAEDARVVAENARAAAEDLREGAEDDRAAAETARETAEAARVAAEALRVTAEGSRETAEAAREAQASADHTVAAGDHMQAAADHTQAAADHTTAASDHTQAGADHTQAAADHTTAAADHTQAQADHAVMEGYDDRLDSVESEVSQLEAKKVDIKFGKNIFDGKFSYDGYRLQYNGARTASESNAISEFIPVEESTQYCYSSNNASYPPMLNTHYLCYYDSTKTFLSSEANSTGNVMAFTTPVNCAYIKVTINKAALDYQIQLEKGGTRTTYAPYNQVGGYTPEKFSQNSIPGTALSNNSVTGGKIADNGIPEGKTTFADIFRNVNILPLGGWESGYYNSNGTQGTSATMCRKKVQIIGAGVYKFYVYRAFFGSGASTIPFYDENGNFVKSITGVLDSSTDAVTINTITVTQADVNLGCYSFGYSYFSNGYDPTHPIEKLMVVKDIEYPSTFIPYLSFTRIKGTLPLYGKKVVFDGDSICAGLNSAQGVFENGWAGRIGPINSMDWHNVGVSGGVITQGLPVSHILSSYIDTIHTDYPNLDFLILEGGTNDADRLFNQSKEGTMSETDFSGNYDATTFIGAMETLLYKAQSYYPNAKVGFIVAQKMGRALNADNNPDPYIANRRHFFDLAIQVCKKWGVPYIDLWEEGYLNPNVSSFYDKSKTAEQNRAEGKAYYDGQHLTAVGYDVISPKIEAWMKTL